MKKALVVIILCAVALLVVALLPEGSEALLPNHECAYCHNVHGASGFGSLLKNEVVETLCLTCHGPGGTSTLKADIHVNAPRSIYNSFSITCTGCHDSHDNRINWLGAKNIQAVGSVQDSTRYARIDTPNSGIRDVVFESLGSNEGQPTLHSFADGDEDGNGIYDGVCETCHTQTKYHRNNSSGTHSHNVGKTCTRCHAHVDGFLR